MNFDYSEEQNMLRDSVARFVQDQYDFDTRRSIAESELGMDENNWATFAELGWLSIPFAEEYGGFGGSVIDVAALMEELGKGLVVEPFFPTVVLFGGLLNKGGSADIKNQYIPKIVEGNCQGAFAYVERQSRFEQADVITTATREGDNYSISGEKVLVANGHNANSLIVSARTSGGQFDQSGISLFLVDVETAGVDRSAFALMDGSKVANIRFDNVVVPAANLIGSLDQGWDLIESITAEAATVLSAEALGIMETLNTATCEYTKIRKQFDVPISSFQVLQHRMVDTFMAYEQAKSMLYRALCEWERGDDMTRTIHALKVMMARSGKLVGDEALQMHGGIGMTDELNIGHYVKRLMTINTQFGNGDFHQQQFNKVSYS